MVVFVFWSPLKGSLLYLWSSVGDALSATFCRGCALWQLRFAGATLCTGYTAGATLCKLTPTMACVEFLG